MSLFKLRGQLSGFQKWIFGLLGTIIFIAVWWGIAELKSVNKPIIKDFQSVIPSSLGTGIGYSPPERNSAF